MAGGGTRRSQPPHYNVYRSANGYKFTHVGTYDTDEARAIAYESDAFAAFTADVAARCVTPPETMPHQVVEGYNSR